MAAAHPLDRPIWSCLTGRQAHLTLGRPGAVRLHPQIGVFAATVDNSPESLAELAALIHEHGPVGVMTDVAAEAVPRTRIEGRLVVDQMVAERSIDPPAADVPPIPLGDPDAPEMLALATLTEPGPYFARTHRLGDYVGVREGGRLIAMAGERMRPDGFTEVSAVCTHPDGRGRGLAMALTRHVASRIQARGETPFLHVFPTNASAIRIYEALGFARRREHQVTILTPVEPIRG
jgi:predicted GNAT family acetyltransferase